MIKYPIRTSSTVFKYSKYIPQCVMFLIKTLKITLRIYYTLYYWCICILGNSLFKKKNSNLNVIKIQLILAR